MREIYSSSTKTFVIDHPNDEDKYLVHGCLEGPEAGVYYRGVGKIFEDCKTDVYLPDYLFNLAYDFTVQITPIGLPIRTLVTSKVDGKFTVYGDPGEFFWTVFGKRENIEIEPNKSNTFVNGSGPYRWI